MDILSGLNEVIFTLADGSESVKGSGLVWYDDLIQDTWQRARADRGLRERDVSEIHTIWEPAEADVDYLESAFPSVPLGFVFARPGPGGWAQAFDAARRTIEDAAERQDAESAKQQVRARALANSGQVVPVLWSHSSPKRAALDYLPTRVLVPGRLSVGVANTARIPRGTVFMDHLGHAGLADRPFERVMTDAMVTLESTLDWRVGTNPDRGRMVEFTREGGFATSAIVSPMFYEQMSQDLGERRLVIGLRDPDRLYVTGAGSGWVDWIHETVLGHDCAVSELVPTVLRMDESSGFEIVAERTGHPEPEATELVALVATEGADEIRSLRS
ncbi:MAG: hypothetical protein ACRCYQ_09470 [Nocardioides sp.]